MAKFWIIKHPNGHKKAYSTEKGAKMGVESVKRFCSNFAIPGRKIEPWFDESLVVLEEYEATLVNSKTLDKL